jgi:hypothetical protein
MGMDSQTGLGSLMEMDSAMVRGFQMGSLMEMDLEKDSAMDWEWGTIRQAE